VNYQIFTSRRSDLYLLITLSLFFILTPRRSGAAILLRQPAAAFLFLFCAGGSLFKKP
jgi:hypothetical protein